MSQMLAQLLQPLKELAQVCPALPSPALPCPALPCTALILTCVYSELVGAGIKLCEVH